MTARPVRNTARSKAAPMFLHQKILSDIQGKIMSGEWEVGRRIPVEHELMTQYDCSRMTVSKVLTRLAHAGLIERHRKVGSFVGRPHSQSAVLDIPDIKTEVGALGLPYSFDVQRRQKRRSTREDKQLVGKDGSVPLLEITCLHMAGAQPFCLEERMINLQAVPEAAAETFTELSPGAWLLRRVPWRLAEHRIRAAAPEAEVAAVLGIKAKTPCLVVERTTRGVDSTITFVRLTYPGNLHELVASFTPFAPVAQNAGSGSSAPRPKRG
ncbi:MAG: histidine utilization repressor [Pseudomonadota bacterium]